MLRNFLKLFYLKIKFKIRNNWRLRWTLRFCYLVKWWVVYYVFKHHDQLADSVLWWSPKIFYFKYRNYYETILTYEAYLLGAAFFFLFFFIWKHTVFRFFGVTFNTLIYFVYFYFFFFGFYLIWLGIFFKPNYSE